MEKNIIDRIFSEKLGKISDLPPGVNWNSRKGWDDYEKQYLSSGHSQRKLFLLVGSAVAALLTGIILILYFTNTKPAILSVSNETTVPKEIVLPDGNRVYLNRNSTLSYPARIDNKHYEFTLKGEAYFEIMNLQHSVYTINAMNAVIQIENAVELNVHARDQEDNVNITVETGAIKVRDVSYSDGLALLVTEGNYCSVHKSQNLVYSSVNKNVNFSSWKTGHLSFNSLPMATVADVLAEYYNTEIELTDKSLAYCIFSGNFSDPTLDIVLHKLQTDLSFEIRNAGDKILISGKGCL